MEFIPGVGVAAARIGEPKVAIDERLGRPDQAGRRAVYTGTEPMLIVHYDHRDTAELVEIGYGVDEQVYFEGVQLTYRIMDDVVEDLARRGLRAHTMDIGYAFEPGFAIFSMSSLTAADLPRANGPTIAWSSKESPWLHWRSLCTEPRAVQYSHRYSKPSDTSRRSP